MINNLSSSGSPDLILDSVTDTVIGSLTAIAAANGCSTLAAGGSCSFDANYTIQAGDPDPLVNVVTVHYHPANFPNDITDTDDHALDLIALQGCTPGFWQAGLENSSGIPYPIINGPMAEIPRSFTRPCSIPSSVTSLIRYWTE